MDRVVREWRDVWCTYHEHLESDWECQYMFDSGYFGESSYTEGIIRNVTAKLEIREDDE